MSIQSMGEHQFLWRIENFSACTKETKLYISSPIISATDLDSTIWILLIAPRGVSDDSFVSVKLCRDVEDDGPTNIHLELQFCLIDLYGKERFKRSASFTFTNADAFVLDKFVRRSNIYDDKDTLLPNGVLTLRCRAWKSDRDRFVATRSVVRTKIDVERSTFLWTVRGLTGKASATRKSIHIETRFVQKGLEMSCVDAVDEQKTPGAVQELRLSIEPKRFPKGRIFISAKIQVLGGRQNSKIEAESFLEARSKAPWHLPGLDISDRMESILEDDRLDLTCEFSISDGSQVKQTEGSLVPLVDKFHLGDRTLLQDIGSAYESGANADVMVTVPDGHKHFMAHKIILSARSRTFRSVLNDFEAAKKRHFDATGVDPNHPAKPNDVGVGNDHLRVSVENGVDCAEVSHVSTEILGQMLKCMYTDVLDPEGYNNAIQLYKAGAKFGFDLLRERSEYYLKSQICLESLCGILIFAHSNAIPGLKKECMNYITENREFFHASGMLTCLRDDHGSDLYLDVSAILKPPK